MTNTENPPNEMHPPAGTPGNSTATPTYAAGSLPTSTPPAKPKKKPQKCPQCPPGKKAFKNEGALASHLSSGYHIRKGNLSHTKKAVPPPKPPVKAAKKAAKCPECPLEKSAFKNNDALTTHLSSGYHDRHASVGKPPKVAPPKSTPPKHRKKAVKCPKCPPERKAFKNKDTLANHLSSGYHEQHGDESKPEQAGPKASNTTPAATPSQSPRKLRCAQCPPGRLFICKEALESHLSSGYHDRHGDESKPEQASPKTPNTTTAAAAPSQSCKCPQCPPRRKQFKNKVALANHLSSGYHGRHGDQSKPAPPDANTPNTTPAQSSKKQKCPQCPPSKKPFKNEDALASHLSSSHHKRKGNLNPGPKVPQAEPIATTPEPLTPNEELIKNLASTLANSPRTTFPSSLLRSFTTDQPVTQMLVLSPTREIAEYTHDRLMARVEPFNITSYVCASGLDLIEGRRGVLGAAHIVSGTVTWVGYAVRKGYVDVSGVSLLVLNKEEALLTGDIAEGVAELVGLLEGVQVVRASVRIPGEDAEV